MRLYFFPVMSLVLPAVVLPIAELLCQAVRHAHLTEQQFSLELGISPQQWNQQKNGIGHISLTRIAERCPDVLRWLALVWLQTEGLPRELEHARPIIAAVQDMDRRIA